MSDTFNADSAAAANDISKEEILRHIFGEIGELIEGLMKLTSIFGKTVIIFSAALFRFHMCGRKHSATTW